MSKQYLTTGESAEYLGISQSTVINYIDRGILKPDIILPSKSGKVGRRKFSYETLDNFKKLMTEGDKK